MNDFDILWIDVESTGVDAVKDRIVELGMVYHAGGKRTRWCKRFNPGVPIPPEATEVHGITDADVANEKPFSAYAPIVCRAIAGKHLGGYNLRRLDLPLIDEELRRCNLKLDLSNVLIIDAAAIFFKREPRALEDAVRRYCRREHGGKHGAAADAEATVDVFDGQLAEYPDLALMPLDQIAQYARLSEGKDADLAGKLKYDAEGRLCFAFGKHRDLPVLDHMDYADWMLRATNPGFPGSTCDMLRKELQLVAEKAPTWENNETLDYIPTLDQTGEP